MYKLKQSITAIVFMMLFIISSTATPSPGSQTITFNPLPVKTFGDADFTPGASSSSGLGVTYSSSDTNTATIVSGKVHIKRAGVTVITASQAGDGSYSAATPVAQTLWIWSPIMPVFAWGDCPPNIPSSLDNVVAIATGSNHTVALKSNGTVVAWGNNDYGQTSTPSDLDSVVAVAACCNNTVALKSNGTVVAWGDNYYGQKNTPSDLDSVVAIAAGARHTVALKSDGTVVAWGSNESGQTAIPSGLNSVVAIAAGYYYTVALKSDGTVVAWGDNYYGQTTIPSGLNGVVAIAAGAGQTVVLKSNGTVVAWGENYSGETDIPSGLNSVVAIAAGEWHTVALKSNGTVVAWGNNTYGQVTIPLGLNSVVAIAAGAGQTVVLGFLSQTITFNPLPDKTFGDVDFALNATGGASGQPVTYNSSDTNTATVVSGKVHIKRAGVTVITASQAGKSSYLPATPVSQTLTIKKALTVVTWTDPSDITYGTLLSDTQLNATANTAGDFIYTPASGIKLNAGNGQTLTVKFVPEDTVNYDTVLKSVFINVRKVIPVVTWSNPSDIVYSTLLDSTQLNATADVAGELIYTPANGTKLNAGNGQSLTVKFVPTDMTNYDTVSKTVTISVRKAIPVLTWANPSDITYSTLLDSKQLNATADVAGAFFYTPGIGITLNAGNGQSLTVKFVPTEAANYDTISKSVIINVTKAKPVITWVNPSDIIYGMLLDNSQLRAIADAYGAFIYTPPIGTKLNAGDDQSLTVKFVPIDPANYDTISKSVSLNVKKAMPVITWANPSDIIYGTLLSDTQLNATANTAGDFTYTPASGAKLNAGDARLFTEFVPTDTVNYKTVPKSVVINVKPVTPVITWTNPSDITYMTALSNTQLNATANTAGYFIYTPASGTRLNVGNAQSLTGLFVPTDRVNYDTVSRTVSINVRKAKPEIVWANPLDITYGTLLNSTQLNATTDVAGGFTYTPASGTKLNAGNAQSLTVKFAPTDIVNFDTVSKAVSINVSKKTVTITGVTVNNKVYDGTTDATISGGTPVGLVEHDDVTLASGTVSFADKNAGKGIAVTVSSITFSGADAGNYTFEMPTGLTADITKRPLTITADDKMIKVAGADLVFTVTYNGFVTGDDSSVLSGLVVNREPGTAAGKYAIIPSGATASNYNITFVNGTLTINEPTSIKPVKKIETSSDQTGIFIMGNPVSVNAPNAVIVVKTHLPATVHLKICDATGNIVDEQDGRSSVTGGMQFNWDLYNRYGRRVTIGTYAAFANVKFSDGEEMTLKAMIGVKK